MASKITQIFRYLRLINGSKINNLNYRYPREVVEGWKKRVSELIEQDIHERPDILRGPGIDWLKEWGKKYGNDNHQELLKGSEHHITCWNGLVWNADQQKWDEKSILPSEKEYSDAVREFYGWNNLSEQQMKEKMIRFKQLNNKNNNGENMNTKIIKPKDEAGVFQDNRGKNVIISMENGKDLRAIFLGYNEKGMVIDLENQRTTIPLGAIKVTHLV
jgi:hypothetical protein